MTSNIRLRKTVLGRQPSFIREAHNQLELDRARSPKRRRGRNAACESGGAGSASEGCEHQAGSSRETDDLMKWIGYKKLELLFCCLLIHSFLSQSRPPRAPRQSLHEASTRSSGPIDLYIKIKTITRNLNPKEQ